jgi:hypothetical protein
MIYTNIQMLTTVAIFAIAVVSVATAGQSKAAKIADLGAVLQGSDGGALGINKHGEKRCQEPLS